MAEDNPKEIQKEEVQFVSLLIKNRDLVEDFKESPLNMEYFDSTNRMILHAVGDAHEKGVTLTRKSFLDFASKLVGKKEIARLEVAFNNVSYATANRNDYPMLKERILDTYLTRQAGQYTREFSKDKESKGTVYAIQQMAARMTDLAGSFRDKKGKIVYEDLANFGKDYYQNMIDVRAGNVPDAEFISYGIDELDFTSGVGLAPGTMTLFCGDVGGFKSTMMMNVGLHVWYKANYNVLFVPLEMPRDLVYKKMLSRQTRINFDLINNPKMLKDDQVERLRKFMLEDWPGHDAKMYILDSFEERTRVSLIRRMIERNLEVFKPRLVIVDYIANLEPDKKGDRRDIEIGSMLKDLRYMGRPGVLHNEGFAIVSGAQIGREGLKRVRKGGNDKAMFYSEDIRESHDYSADTDTMYAQFPDPQDDSRLQVFCVKARYGKKAFSDGSKRALLEVKPEISLIRSVNDVYDGSDKSEVLKKAATDEGDLDFSSPTPAAATGSFDDFSSGGGSDGGTGGGDASMDDFLSGI